MQPRNVKWLPALPFFGKIVALLKGTWNANGLEVMQGWQRQMGCETFAFEALGNIVLMTIDPKNVEHFMKTNFKNYVKGTLFSTPFADLLGNGIFISDGDVWHQQRKTASRMFTKKQFETHILTVVRENTAKCAHILRSTSGTFDMFQLMNRFTLDTIGQIGFSKHIGSLENPTSPFLRSFDRAQKLLMKRFWLDPYWKVVRALRIGWEPELEKHLKILDDYAYAIVAELEEKARGGIEDNSFVGLFMKDGGDAASPQEQKKACRDMVLNFLIAGRDTTAQCLSWTLFELTQHPEVAAKLRNEVEEVCGADAITYDQLNRLAYVRAVLDEGLRLHPSVPMDGKMAVGHDVLPDGTTITPGCLVQFSPWVQGRYTKLWGSDAETFRPERWLTMETRPSSYAWTAFNAGPRECLGKRLAEMEMTFFLASTIRDFDFVLEANPKSISYEAQLTLGMNGLPLSVRPLR